MEDMVSSEETILMPETVSGNDILLESIMDNREGMKPKEDSIQENVIENNSQTSEKLETEETAEMETTEKNEPKTEITTEGTESTAELPEESSNEEETVMPQEQEQTEPGDAVAENVTETAATEEIAEDMQTEVQEVE